MEHTIAGWRGDVCRMAIGRNGQVVALIEFPIFRCGCGIRFCLSDFDHLDGGTILGLRLKFVTALVEFPRDKLLFEENCFCATPCLVDFVGGTLDVLFK